MEAAYRKALEIVAERPVIAEELDAHTMDELASEVGSGQYSLARPTAEQEDAFMFALLGLKTLSQSASDFERAASVRLLRASADAVERLPHVTADSSNVSDRIVCVSKGGEIKIVAVRYLPGRSSKSALIESLRLD